MFCPGIGHSRNAKRPQPHHLRQRTAHLLRHLLRHILSHILRCYSSTSSSAMLSRRTWAMGPFRPGSPVNRSAYSQGCLLTRWTWFKPVCNDTASPSLKPSRTSTMRRLFVDVGVKEPDEGPPFWLAAATPRDGGLEELLLLEWTQPQCQAPVTQHTAGCVPCG